MNENNILGVVLAGGKSKRFGEDKSKVILGDKTLLEHTLHKIKSKFNNVVIVSNNSFSKDYTIINMIRGTMKKKYINGWVAQNQGIESRESMTQIGG